MMAPRIATNTMPNPTAPTCGDTGHEDTSSHPKLYFLDNRSLDRKSPKQEVTGPPRATLPMRCVGKVDDKVAEVRANVQDAAKAVLTWLSAVVAHEGQTDLDNILDQCLRPGPDPARINYTALAKQINQMLCIDLSPRRVQTAIEHLRNARVQQPAVAPRRKKAPRFDLVSDLLKRYEASLTGTRELDVHAKQTLALALLGAVRSAAGRLIENDFGEGIPVHVDLDELRQHFLEFVQDAVNDSPASIFPFDPLHRALNHHDGSAICDMLVVTAGSRAVIELAGRDTLPGVLAQLNVVVVGREMLGSELYRAELFRLAQNAAHLHDDPDTRRLLRQVRQIPAESRIPSPLRVRSYCLNNAATHILGRLFTGELPDLGGQLLAKAQWCIDQMCRRDGAFQLLDATRAIYATTLGELNDDNSAAVELFRGWDRDRLLNVLRDLVSYDNCPALVEAVRSDAIKAMPDLRFALICVR